MLQIYSLDLDLDAHPEIMVKLKRWIGRELFEVLIDDIKEEFHEIINHTTHAYIQLEKVLNDFYVNTYFVYPQIHPQLMTSFANTVLKWGKEYNIEIIVFTHDMDLIESFVSSDLIPDNQNVFTRVSKDETMKYSKQEILDAIESNIDFR